jgi:hypothetical protein
MHELAIGREPLIIFVSFDYAASARHQRTGGFTMRVQDVLMLVGSISLVVSGLAIASPMPPLLGWDVDYGDTQCTAAQSFGNPDKPVVLGIVPSIGAETFKVMVSIPHEGPPFARTVDASITFGSKSMKQPLLYYGKSGVKMSIYQFIVPATEIEAVRTAPFLVIHAANGTSFDFALTNMSPLLDALKKCTGDLQQYWNFGAEPASGPTIAGNKDPRSAFSGDDYPSEALMRGQSGTSQFRLLVDDKGAVAGCDVFRPSGVPVLDTMGCQVMTERLKYTPAKDPKGEAQRSVITTPPVTWRVEGGFDIGPVLTSGAYFKG